MKTTISLHDFRNAFRECRPDNFTYEGLERLFDYLEQFDEDCGEEQELDVIAICCDFSEDTIEEVLSDYSLENIQELEDNTTVLYIGELNDYRNPSPDTRIIYANY